MSRAQRTDGPVIDIHCHRECAPAADLMRDAALAAGKVALGHGNATTRKVNERQLATIKPKMDVLDVRIADMDAMGVDMQAVAIAVYQYYYWADAELGAKVSRMMNEEFVESTARYGDRFVPLGTVPLQDTEAAVQELRYLVQELGMRGIEIGTHVEGEEISSPPARPVLGRGREAGRRRRDPHPGHHPPAAAPGAQLRQHPRPPVRGDPGAGAPHLRRRHGAAPRPQDRRRARRRLPAGLRRPDRPRLARPGGRPRGGTAGARQLPAQLLLRHDGLRDRPAEVPGRPLRRRPRAARHRLPLRHGRRRPARAWSARRPA